MQEAAYSLIPEEQRAQTHLRIGRVARCEHTSRQSEEEAIFDIVNQLNRGSHLITSAEERERVAELESDRGQTGEGIHGLRLGTQIPSCRPLAINGGDLGA